MSHTSLATLALIPILFGCFHGARTPALDHQVASAKVAKWDQLPAFQEAVDPENFDASKARAACFYATNEQRAKHGKKALERNALLEASAQLHADRMTNKGFFSHEDPHSKALRTPDDRGRKVGVPNPKFAENIAFVTTIDYESGRPWKIQLHARWPARTDAHLRVARAGYAGRLDELARPQKKHPRWQRARARVRLRVHMEEQLPLGKRRAELPALRTGRHRGEITAHLFTGSRTSMPCMYLRSASGTTTEPSACWKFSRIGMRILGDATIVLLSV